MEGFFPQLKWKQVDFIITSTDRFDMDAQLKIFKSAGVYFHQIWTHEEKFFFLSSWISLGHIILRCRGLVGGFTLHTCFPVKNDAFVLLPRICLAPNPSQNQWPANPISFPTWNWSWMKIGDHFKHPEKGRNRISFVLDFQLQDESLLKDDYYFLLQPESLWDILKILIFRQWLKDWKLGDVLCIPEW